MMTETLVAVSPPEQESDEGRRQPSAEELEAARELVRQARGRGVALTGPGAKALDMSVDLKIPAYLNAKVAVSKSKSTTSKYRVIYEVSFS